MRYKSIIKKKKNVRVTATKSEQKCLPIYCLPIARDGFMSDRRHWFQLHWHNQLNCDNYSFVFFSNLPQ